MENIDYFWIILGAITIVLLIIFWQRKNAVWGGFTIGVAIGIITAFILLLNRSDFNWFIVGKLAIVVTLLGFFAELFGKISDYLRINSKNK